MNLTILQVDELHAGAAHAVAGAALPRQHHKHELADGTHASHFFRAPGPVPETPVEDADGHVRIGRGEAPAGYWAPYAPAWVVDLAHSACARHARGEACVDGDGIARRLDSARELAPLPLPARSLAPETCTAQPVVDAALRELLERRALPLALAVGEMVRLVANRRVDWPDEAIAARAKMLATSGALHEWDDVGRALDAAHAEREAARVAEAARAAAQAAYDAELNTKTLGELGLYATRIASREFSAGRRDAIRRSPLTPGSEHHCEDERAFYWLTPKGMLSGVRIVEGQIPGFTDVVMGDDFVPPISRAGLRELASAMTDTTMRFVLEMLRPELPATSTASVAGRDGRTADGMHAEESFVRSMRPYAEDIARHGSMAERFFLHAGIRGWRLRPDIVWNAYEAIVGEVVRDPRGDVLEPARTVYVDANGAARPEPARWVNVQDVHDPSAEKRIPVDEFDAELAPREVPAVVVTERKLPLSFDAFTVMARQAGSGVGALLNLDELFVPADEATLRRFLSVLSPDVWRKAIAAFAADKTQFTSDDVAAALVAAGVVDRLPHDGHTRIKRTLESLGWDKKNLVIDDGKRRWTWVKP